MKNKHKTTLTVLLIAGLMASIHNVKADVLASDTFSAANGTLLDGRTTPVGGLAWSDGNPGGSPAAVIENNGVTTNYGAQYVVGVPFAVGSYTSFSVQADVDPQGPVPAPGYFVAVGFGLSVGTADFTATNSPLWAELKNNGTWYVVQNGVSIIVANGTYTENVGGYDTEKLAYNTATGVVTFTIDGSVEFSNTVAGVNIGAIAVAGVEPFGQTYTPATPNFTNFSLDAVPEPSTVALCIVALGALVFAVKRKNQREIEARG